MAEAKPMAKKPSTRIKKVPATKKPAEPKLMLQEESFFGQLEDTGIDVLKTGKNTVKVISNIAEACNEAMQPVLMELRSTTLETELKETQKVYDLGYSEAEAIAYITTGRRMVAV